MQRAVAAEAAILAVMHAVSTRRYAVEGLPVPAAGEWEVAA